MASGSRHDYAGKPRPTIDLRPPMVIRGFGNTPVPVEMFIPPGTVPPITDVTYAGSYPLRHYLTNPPITTPEYPANPPRATNKAPVRTFAPYDRLTRTRATTAQIPTAQLGSLRSMHSMGALPAGAYSGAVGRVVRALDPATGAGLRGQIVGARLHGHDAPPAYLHGAHGAYLHGFGALPRVLDLKQAVPQDVPDVARFTITDPRVVRGQLVGTRLVLIGVKEGTTTISLESPSGARSETTLTVKGLLPAEQMAVAQQTFDLIKTVTGSRPALKIDWQDADVLRANYDLIYPILRKLFATARDFGQPTDTYRPQRYQALQLLRILVNAKARPDLKTLREVIFTTPVPYTESGTTINVPTPATHDLSVWSTRSRECTVEGGERYRALFAFARDTSILFDIGNAVLKIAEIAGKAYSAYDPATGQAISDGAAAARAVAAPALASFARDAKRLVGDFGAAVCAAVAGGEGAIPLVARAAATLRQEAIAAAARYRELSGRGLSGLGLTASTAAEARTQGQEALARLETLDMPSAFTPAQNAELEAARQTLNAGTSLTPGSGSGGGGGGGGGGGRATSKGGIPTPLIVVGVAAGAFVLWRVVRR